MSPSWVSLRSSTRPTSFTSLSLSLSLSLLLSCCRSFCLDARNIPIVELFSTKNHQHCQASSATKLQHQNHCHGHHNHHRHNHQDDLVVQLHRSSSAGCGDTIALYSAISCRTCAGTNPTRRRCLCTNQPRFGNDLLHNVSPTECCRQEGSTEMLRR